MGLEPLAPFSVNALNLIAKLIPTGYDLTSLYSWLHDPMR